MTDENRDLIRLFLSVNRQHRKAIEKAAAGLEIHRSQHSVLLYLFRKDVQPTQKEIAEHFDISPAAVAKTIKKLESSGYITRKADEGDTRSNRIAITEKGASLLNKTKELFNSVDEHMLSSINEAQKENLKLCLETMLANLR